MVLDRDVVLREQLVSLLDGGAAHARSSEVLRGFPSHLCDARVAGSAHTAWELVEHLRIAQEDMLRFGLEPG